MGLDMTLSKKTYVKNWDHMNPEELHQVEVRKNGKAVKHIKSERIKYVEEEVIKWRKANAIHDWFVQCVQGGTDLCQSSYVPIEALKTLLKLVKEVLADKNLAEELLPPMAGFFFGNTEIDDYYFQDLEYTKAELTKLLKEDCDCEYYYQSSW